NFLTVLVKDGVQHFLRMNQTMRFGKTFATNVFSIDYAKVAEGIGVEVFKADNKSDLKERVDEAIRSSYKKPTLLIVNITPTSIPSILLSR
ncbi:acetolactate synthase, partial [Sulfolobus sp. E5]